MAHNFPQLTVSGILPGGIRREIRPPDAQPPIRVWLDDEATFDLQDACGLIRSSFVAGLGGDLNHAVEHHGHTADLAQALLERSLQYAESTNGSGLLRPADSAGCQPPG